VCVCVFVFVCVCEEGMEGGREGGWRKEGREEGSDLYHMRLCTFFYHLIIDINYVTHFYINLNMNTN
jgi:hypothetical protein